MAHRKFHSFAVVGALGLCFGWASSVARADLFVTPTIGGSPTGAGSVFVNFDSMTDGVVAGQAPSTQDNGAVFNGGSNQVTVTFGLPLPSGLSEGAAQGSLSGVYAAPFLSGTNSNGFGNPPGAGADTTTFLTTGTGSVTLSFTADQKYLGLLWGSVDSYNTLTFEEVTGSTTTVVGTVTGGMVINNPGGDQGVNGTAYVNINSDTAFNTVVASSTTNAFEFDNVAYNQSNVVLTPEPSTFVVAAVGALGMIGYGWRRKGLRVISR